MNDIHINIGVTRVCCNIWLSWRDLNKSINATVSIFIFSFIYLFFQSILTLQESLSRINIFHNYTVFHYALIQLSGHSPKTVSLVWRL